ncbi:MAG TPA: radical SAM family heme chaperone HemW [Acidobacteriota bacterium]|nr:radical SAM family heme chaperone HemW [Acidobacteriota bacterium]
MRRRLSQYSPAEEGDSVSSPHGSGRRWTTTPGPLGLYVHIPFCVRKCFYCDFNSGPVGEVKRRRHLEALENEIRNSPYGGARARTLFLGGGTPSELRLGELTCLIEALRDSFDLSPLEEWTIECNPGTLTPPSLEVYRRLGIDRISLGVQSFHDGHLKALGRVHDAQQARTSIRWIRQAGFDNLNLDLIFALPHQTLDEWRADVEESFSYRPEHVSLYNLTIEPGTEFGRRRQAGLLLETAQDLAADMFQTAIDDAEKAGMIHYEISNFALPGRECLHNRIYWRNEDYLGLGVGASSYVDGLRWTNCGDLDDYAQGAARGWVPREVEERLPARQALGEEIMLRLRTREGADLAALSDKYGLAAQNLYAAPLQRLQSDGLISLRGTSVTLTPRGIFLADQVCAEFLV